MGAMYVIVNQVVKDLVKAWHEEYHPWGVSVKNLVNAVYEAGWRRHLEGTLTVRLYVPHPQKYSAEEETAEHESEDVEEGATSETVMLQAAKRARAEGSSGDPEDQAGPEWDTARGLLLNPDDTFDTDEARRAQEHADRWTEESMAREMLDKITWADYCPEDKRWELYRVFELGMEYVDTFDNGVINRWDMSDVPTHMRVWLAELEWTWNTLVAKNWIPRDCRSPHDKFIRERATGAQGHVDPGNKVYDVLVNIMRLWRAVDLEHYQQVVKVAGKEYGERGNKSAQGPANLRGNIVESMLRWCQAMGSTPEHLPEWKQWSCREYYLGWYKY